MTTGLEPNVGRLGRTGRFEWLDQALVDVVAGRPVC
jgi:hypothetical protein